MASHIASHNKKILQNSREQDVQDRRTCNCEQPENCPLNGSCLQEAAVYQADVTPETEEAQSYLGLTEPPFKGRWLDHCTSFRYEKYKSKSKLSTFIWKLQKKRENYNIKWSIIRKSIPYRTGSKKNVIYACGKSTTFFIAIKKDSWIKETKFWINVGTVTNFCSEIAPEMTFCKFQFSNFLIL